MKYSILFILFVFMLLRAHHTRAQSVLIEEFTNLGTPDYALTHSRIDSILDSITFSNFCVIKYHTDFPGADTFNADVNVDVDRRLSALGGMTELAATVVDGKFRPDGPHFLGSTLNLRTSQLDSIRDAKIRDIRFFGLDLNFSADFKKIYGSSGMVTLNSNEDLPVHHYRVLVEEIVDTDSPVGPNGETQFSNVFRGFISYRLNNNIPGNGSTHGWGSLDIPESVINLSNLKMVVFVAHIDGRVIDCTSVNVSPVDNYKIEVTNNSTHWSKYCDSIVIPKVEVKNVGPKNITGLSITSKLDGQLTTKYIDTLIEPNQSITFEFEKDTLPPGRHYIHTDVEYIIDAIGSAVIVQKNDSLRYLISGKLDEPDEDFENLPENDIGNFMVRAQTDLAFKKITAADIGHDQKIGAFGRSDNSLMVDQWNWDWDEEDAGNVFLRDNKNFGFLLYNRFDLSKIKFPALYFDVAAATKPNHQCLEIGISRNYCGNDFQVLKEFFCHELNTAPQNSSSFFIPDSTQWQTKRVSLQSNAQDDAIQIRFWTSNHVDFTYPNAFYIDNIRVVSEADSCVAGNVQLTTQAEVDSFTSRMEGCNISYGDICIGYCNGEDTLSNISDISGFSSLIEIGGSLSIVNNPLLLSANGFQSLRFLEGDLTIQHNDTLQSLSNIRLTKLGGSVRVIDNPELDELFVFPTNKPINGDLVIKGNPKLNYFWIGGLTGINGNCVLHDLNEVTSFGSSNTALTYIGGDLSIQNNQLLRLLSVFRILDEIKGNYVIKDNSELTSLVFSSHTKIDGDFVIVGNDSLKQLSVWNLDSLGGSMDIRNNATLHDISSLRNLDYDYFNSLQQDSIYMSIINNKMLSSCNTELLCRLLADADRVVDIDANGDQCGDKSEVISACLTGVASVEKEAEFHIFPNPTSKSFQIKSKGTVVKSIEVFHTSGEHVMSYENDIPAEIDLSQLAAGMYFIRINKTFVNKVVKY
jgi:hypothetical protein